MLMFTREGSSCNNNRRLTGDMQQAKSLRGRWREYTVSSALPLQTKTDTTSSFFSKAFEPI